MVHIVWFTISILHVLINIIAMWGWYLLCAMNCSNSAISTAYSNSITAKDPMNHAECLEKLYNVASLHCIARLAADKSKYIWPHGAEIILRDKRIPLLLGACNNTKHKDDCNCRKYTRDQSSIEIDIRAVNGIAMACV